LFLYWLTVSACQQHNHNLTPPSFFISILLCRGFYSHQFYINRRPVRYEERNVLAIRTEHLWSDFLQLDQLLGGQGEYQRPNGVVAFRHKLKKRIPPANMMVNAQDIIYLCCELLSIGEIQVYWQILERADNLDDTSKQQSKMALLDQCGGGFHTLDDLQQKCQENEFSIL
jgi:hypothetical protein